MDPFRSKYRELTPEEQELMRSLKDKATEMYDILSIQDSKFPRELALARTKLEESVMWAVKAITG